MNILTVVPWDEEYGGVASVVGNVGLLLQQNGNDILFFHPDGTHTLKAKTTKWCFPGYQLRLLMPVNPNAPIKSVVGFVYYFCSTMYQLARLISRHKIDIVNIHYPTESFVYFALLRKLLSFKLVISVHGADLFPDGKPRLKYSGSLRMLMHVADFLIAPSRDMLNRTLAVFPGVTRKCTVIHNAVNMSEFEGDSGSLRKTEEYVLCIANHNFKKAVDVLLYAFAELHVHYPELNLWLVGMGPLTDELKQLSRNLELTRWVKFLGSRNRHEIKELLNFCKVFVLPSRAEPFGIVVLEALASRKAVIATAVGGIPEVIESGVSGILVEPDDPRALCNALRAVLQDAALGAQLASRGYEIVKEHFQWELAGAKYQSVFSSVLSGFEKKVVVESLDIPTP